jgi:hypothetical protein
MKERPSINPKHHSDHTCLHRHSTLSNCTISTMCYCSSCILLWNSIRYWNPSSHLLGPLNKPSTIIQSDVQTLLNHIYSLWIQIYCCRTWNLPIYTSARKAADSSRWQLPYHSNSHRQLCMSTGAARANWVVPSLLSSSRKWDLGFQEHTWLCKRIHLEHYWEMLTIHFKSMEHLGWNWRYDVWDYWWIFFSLPLCWIKHVPFSRFNKLHNTLKYTAHYLALSALDEYYIWHNEHCIKDAT